MSEWGSEVRTVGETQQALSSLPLTGAPREARSFLLLCCCVPTHFHACLNTCQYFREWEKNPHKNSYHISAQRFQWFQNASGLWYSKPSMWPVQFSVVKIDCCCLNLVGWKMCRTNCSFPKRMNKIAPIHGIINTINFTQSTSEYI